MDQSEFQQLQWGKAPVKPRLTVAYIFREVMGVFVMGVALFWSAGRIDWWPAWAAILALSCLFFALLSKIVL